MITKRLSPGASWKMKTVGSMLVMVMVSLVMLSGIMMASIHMYKTQDQVLEHQLHYHGQAVNAAKAGLIDALSWFRRQTVQPVEENPDGSGGFSPVRDMLANPPINDTDDALIGLVREYQISTRDYHLERHEIRKKRILPATFPHRPDDSIVGVQDITDQHNDNSGNGGRFWYIEAKGFIFQRLDPTYQPDQFYLSYESSDGHRRRKLPGGGLIEENFMSDGELEEKLDLSAVRVLASAKMATELRRLTVTPPAMAAFCAKRGDQISLGNRSRVLGGAHFGIAYPTSTGSYYKHSGAELDGAPGYQAIPTADYPIDMEEVFGMSREELQILSDLYIDNPSEPDSIPAELPDYALVYIEGDVVFSASRPLRGMAAIVYVHGDVTIDANSSSYFTGILYVDGSYMQSAPSLINGTVMCSGPINISGLGDYSEATFDPGARQRILTISGQYRFSAPMYYLDD